MDRSSTIQQKQSPISEPIIDDASTDAPLALQAADDKFITDAALLVTQGKHRFYSMVLPSDVLAATCTADTRQENPIDGFQRLLDKRRARDIADYIDSGFGSRPARSFFQRSRARSCIMIAPARSCDSAKTPALF